jgi:DNA helicase INO80
MHTNGWDPRQEDASQPHAGRARDTIKRTVSGISEATSEQDASLSQGPPLTKRRRVDPEDPEDAEITYVGKGKGKAIAPVDDTESVSSVKVKKKSKRKEEAAGVSLPPDEASSRASSPAPSTASAVYEMGDIIPPLKRARKQDDMALAKRLRNLEEAQRKIWHTIAKKDVPKVGVEN